MTFYTGLLQGLNKFYSPFSGFAGVLWIYRYIGLSVLHVSIHLKFKQCCVHIHCYPCKLKKLLRIKKFAFIKNLQKVFLTALSQGFNIHSKFANARYKFYCRKQCRINLVKIIWGLYWKILIRLSMHTFLQFCQFLFATFLTWLPSDFSFFLYIQRGSQNFFSIRILGAYFTSIRRWITW